jgi:hypothetical protein
MSETPETRNEWRSPQFIAPIIAAVCTVLVAVIGLVSNQARLNQVPVATVIVTVPATEVAGGESIATPLAATPVPDAASSESASTTEAEAGTPNVTLFYDEDSFTVWNNTDSTLSLAEVSFRSNGETWDMSIWGSMVDALPAKKCLRLRDVNTREQDPPEACTEAESIHGFFEVGSSNVYWRDIATFEVVHDERVIATCEMAAEMCEIYVAQ